MGSVVLSSGLVLSDVSEGFSGVTPDHPIIGYHNIVTVDNIVAGTEDPDYPVSNLANPMTFPLRRWRALNTTAQYLTVTTGTADDIDYVGIGPHNLFTEQVPVSIEGSEGGSPEEWVELVAAVILPSDGPAIFRFTAGTYTGIRIRLQAGAGAAEISVVHVGKLLVLMRKLYVGVTPLPRGRVHRVVHGQSEAAHYLGSIQLGTFTKSQVPLTLLEPAWARAYLDPFLASRPAPFFIATRPESYPLEAGYAWLTNDPMPVPTAPSNLDACTLEMTGTV